MPEDGLRCHLCAHVAHDTTRLEQHLALVHEKDVTYKCGICGFICQWNKDYYSHMKTHFQGPPFKCDCCKLKQQCYGGELLMQHYAHIDCYVKANHMDEFRLL
jgi:hypothetical protein